MYLNLEEKNLNQPIYRIIPYNRLIELFENEENVLVKPTLWEDTFENLALKTKLKDQNGQIHKYNVHERMYGQCWTLEKSSDAMWRIYSSKKDGIRIKTTINKLLDSICLATLDQSGCEHCVGKVEYLEEKEIISKAKATFGNNGEVSFGNLFRSLLVKRKAFKHENEIRIMFCDWGLFAGQDNLFKYKIEPHDLISQIMIDPRIPWNEFENIQKNIREKTSFKGDIKRSLLYELPEEITININKINT